MEPAGTSLPSVLSAAPILHALVRVELTNGVVLHGRIAELEPLTMNMRLEEINETTVLRRASKPAAAAGSSSSPATTNSTQKVALEKNPAALRCVKSAVIRGAMVKSVEFLSEEASGGRGVGDLLAAVDHVTPTVSTE